MTDFPPWLTTLMLVPALGTLVKWWMSGTEKRIEVLVERVESVVARMGEQHTFAQINRTRIEALEGKVEKLEEKLHKQAANVQTLLVERKLATEER
ncbi:MAG: hypothetical protein ACK4N5_03825 [Myxococcales bacterium]